MVNADESEPGACKDMPTLLNNPQALIEGIVIACYAINAHQAFIYVRGEVLHVVRRLRFAVAEAYEAGYLGTDVLGSGFDLDVVVHAGAGAYICGEETALLDSLEGYRGQPRLKPPFPAVAWYASPTVVNNVSSTPLFTDEHLDVPLDYESVAAAGSMLGIRSVQLFDETTCVVRVVLRWIKFYEHESCGKCTPCREGSWWVVQLLEQLERGEAQRR